LETIKQSYVNTINELNTELLTLKEECEQLRAVKQVLNNQLEKQRVDFDREEDEQRLGNYYSSPYHFRMLFFVFLQNRNQSEYRMRFVTSFDFVFLLSL